MVQGRTRWRRFAVVVIPAAAIAGVLVAGMANGAVPATFSVSGSQFKVSADRLEAWGFVQYGGLASGKDADRTNPRDPRNHPVATAGMARAQLTKLCQSVAVPDLPVSMVIRAGEAPNKPVEAKNLLIDMTDLTGDAVFDDINIGQDASTLTAANDAGSDRQVHGADGGFGQQAKHVVITNVKQTAWSTSAGTFTLNGLHLYVNVNTKGGPPETCFP
jgi:hypothetical protein